MQINKINFGGSLPTRIEQREREAKDEVYPIGGGKVEKYEFEVKHGMRPSSYSDIFVSSADDSCPSSISDLYPDGCLKHNPWFPLDD